MLRYLFVILAVVATILAFLFNLPVLYLGAAVLLGFATVEIAGKLKKRREKLAEPYAPRPQQVADDDLASLGIVSIRPKEKGVTSVPTSSQGDTSETAPALAEASTRSNASGPRVRRSDWSGEDAVDPRIQPEVIGPLLQSALAALDANTVVLVRQGDTPQKFHLEAIASRNSFARTRGHFYTKVPLLPDSYEGEPVVLLRVGAKDFAAANLGYYLETLAIRQLAIAPLPDDSGENARRFLLADTMEDAGLDSPRQRNLLREYAEMLSMLVLDATPRRERVSVVAEPAPVEAEEIEDEIEVSPTAESGQRQAPETARPRREIIEEEMHAARAENLPLAFALVHLRDSESVAQQGELFLVEAERALETMLKEHSEGGRVERFGELTYGVFLNGHIAEAERWAIEVQRAAQAEEGILQGGVSMGIVIMGNRHDTPEALREDATEALRESFETGECMMVE